MKMFSCLMVLALFVPAAAFAKMGEDTKKMEACPMMGEKCDSEKMSKTHDGQDCRDIGQYLKNKKELNLTDEQVKQLESIKTDAMKARVKQEADIKIARIEMMEMMKKDAPDFAGLKEKIKHVNALELDVKLAAVDTCEKGYAVLTPEQQKKLPELLKEKWQGRKMMKKEKSENKGLK